MGSRESILRSLAFLAVVGVAACGGYDWRRELRARASYQHDCPESEVHSVPEAREALALLADYARAVREARACRLVGKVARAMVLERANEDRYNELPEVLRW